MRNIGIVTDSNSGITPKTADKYGIHIVPMIFFINGVEYREGISITDEKFFSYQRQGADIKTSQPSIADLIETWEKLLNVYEKIIYIPMSEALSGAYMTAVGLSKEYNEKVLVVNSKRISVTQADLVMNACQLADRGMAASDIKKYLEEIASEASIYITVDTLEYLKRGGRISATSAMMGEMLNIKPVLQIKGNLIEPYAKVRGRNKAKKVIEEAIKSDMENYFLKSNILKVPSIKVGYAGVEKEAWEWVEKLESTFPGYSITAEKLSLNICCHVGVGTIGIAMMI